MKGWKTTDSEDDFRYNESTEDSFGLEMLLVALVGKGEGNIPGGAGELPINIVVIGLSMVTSNQIQGLLS
jgi:hypothetical protein